MKVLLTGGTGLIGKEVGKALVRKGHEITVLTRSKSKALEIPYPCRVIESLSHNDIQDIDAVIHLAGENVGDGRWSAERKKKIFNSRVQLTKNLVESFKDSDKLKTFISASAIGIYGNRADEILTEASSLGNDFLADVCKNWEESLSGLKFGIRKVIFRTGIVLSKDGGALEKMILPFRFGIGGKLGNGRQWMSWIHIDDMTALYVKALEDQKFGGIYNAVTENPVTNEEFTQELAKALGKKAGPAVPAVAIKLALGEMSIIALGSQRVMPENLKGHYSFKFPKLSQALENCVQDIREGNFVFYAEQYLPAKRQDIFPFFADAKNLEEITPPSLKFHIEKVSTPQIQEGTIIDYKLQIRGVPVGWKTEIQEWVPNEKFVDMQMKGPYSLWHHTHQFEDLGPGTLMSDRVKYKLPLGIMGWSVAGKMVQNDIQKIFSFRRHKTHQIILDTYGFNGL